nr:reverse transcriptase domain-containing protein [Tanacetum cinerariifolium]
MKCQPLNFKGTKGVVGLSRLCVKMELVFHISGCAIENQVKFTTSTMLDAALTWWNGHLRNLGHDAAYAMTCYECGNQEHYKSDCPELKNRNHGDQAEGTEARRMVYALGGGETNQNLNDIKDDIND